ncbi:MAG: hypothetical protein JWQ44_2529 [Chthoniobacter sp.]|nr:hypothetical protein [Chthoniobacter sp.]
MLRKPLLSLMLALLLAAAFCYGVGHLFRLRYQSGEVYPEYSTLRPDPLGAKAIFDALGAMPGLETHRNFRPLKKLQPPEPITLVYAGVKWDAQWTEREFQEFKTIVSNGSRAVFSFFPIERPPDFVTPKNDSAEERKEKKERPEHEKKETQKPDGKDHALEADEEASSGLLKFDEVAKRLGFRFNFLPADDAKTFDRRALKVEAGADLEAETSWHSALCFSELSGEWKVLYTCESQPVIIERQHGGGSIVLAADSFFLSNEALRSERHPRLLAHVFNGPSTIIFDEEHHGVTHQPGVMQLALKYRLQGVIAGLVLVAGLFVWKNSVRFIPAYPDETRGELPIRGKDATQGFVNLLRRTIPPADLPAACVEEWRRAPHLESDRVHVEAALAQELALPKRRRNPAALYQAISRRLERKPPTHERRTH